MIKHHLKVCFKMVFTHITTQIFSLFICPAIFLILLSTKAGWYLMSTSTSIAYAIMVYSCAYKIADKDIKVYSTNKPYILKGIVIALPALLITLILTLLYDFTFYHDFIDYDLQMKIQFIIRNVFKGWNFTFEGFRTAASGDISLFYWVLSYAMLPIASFFGYWAGMNRYDFSEKFFTKLVYKNQPRNK